MCPCSDDFLALPASVVSYFGCLLSHSLTPCDILNGVLVHASVKDGIVRACVIVIFAHLVRLIICLTSLRTGS